MTASRRARRVGDLIREEVAKMVLTELSDPRLATVTITGVEVSADLRHARVFYSVLGDAADAREQAKTAFERARTVVQLRVGERVRLRYRPELSFRYDPSIERGAHMEQIFREISGTGTGTGTGTR